MITGASRVHVEPEMCTVSGHNAHRYRQTLVGRSGKVAGLLTRCMALGASRCGSCGAAGGASHCQLGGDPTMQCEQHGLGCKRGDEMESMWPIIVPSKYMCQIPLADMLPRLHQIFHSWPRTLPPSFQEPSQSPIIPQPIFGSLVAVDVCHPLLFSTQRGVGRGGG